MIENKHFQCLAMFIGAICHDLDHRGFNNKFMIDIGSPLAAIYSTSTMEHHHFNMAVIILQQVSSKWGFCYQLFFCKKTLSYFVGKSQYFCQTKSRWIPTSPWKYEALYISHGFGLIFPQQSKIGQHSKRGRIFLGPTRSQVSEW